MFHGQRSLAGYSPWGCKESDTNDGTDTTEMTDTTLKSMVGKELDTTELLSLSLFHFH